MRKIVRRLSHNRKRWLQERWKGQAVRLSEIMSDLAEGRDWTIRLNEDPEGRWVRLPGIENCYGAAGGLAVARDLRGAPLKNLILIGCDNLSDAYLDHALLQGVAVDGGSWRGASLKGVECSDGCVFRGVNFELADFSGADLGDSSFQGSVFRKTKLVAADFSNAVLDEAVFEEVELNREIVRGFSWGWTRLPTDPERLARIDLSDADRKTVWAIEEAEAFAICRLRFPLFSVFWSLLTNAGRSPFRLLLWVLMTWLFFGWLYAGLPVPFAKRTLALTRALQPNLVFDDPNESAELSGFAPYYFSAVTLTTLGYGDVHPSHGDWRSQVYVTCEAFIGYLFLGLFVSLVLQRVSWKGTPKQQSKEIPRDKETEEERGLDLPR